METMLMEKMNGLDTDAIVELLRMTWDVPEGYVIREFAFEVIEERHGEDESDRIYSMLWHEMR